MIQFDTLKPKLHRRPAPAPPAAVFAAPAPRLERTLLGKLKWHSIFETTVLPYWHYIYIFYIIPLLWIYGLWKLWLQLQSSTDSKKMCQGLDGGHVGWLILRLSEEEQRQRKVEAQIAKFRKYIPSEDERVSSKWQGTVFNKKRGLIIAFLYSHKYGGLKRVTVCHCHVTSNYLQTQRFRFF